MSTMFQALAGINNLEGFKKKLLNSTSALEVLTSPIWATCIS